MMGIKYDCQCVPRNIESEHDCVSLMNILMLVVKTVGVFE